MSRNVSVIDNFMAISRYWNDQIKLFFRCREIFKNYFEVLRKHRSKKFPIKGILKNGTIEIFDNHFDIMSTVRGFNSLFKKENDLLILNENRLKFTDWKDNGDIFSLFFTKSYDHIPVKGTDVIDIGANIGDSAIRFVQNGALKVIAIEPILRNFLSAEKNIKINKMEDKITLINCICGPQKGFTKIKQRLDGLNAITVHDKDGIEIEIKTLNELLLLSKSPKKILKIDCEGCEYDLILNTPNSTLEQFNYIFIEYHHGYKNLVKKLKECRFMIKTGKPKSSRVNFNSKGYVGFMYAYQNE